MAKYTKQQQKEHRQKWTEALRSGDYKQGQNRLRDYEADLYCCLGVACSISGLGSWSNDKYYFGNAYEVSMLPDGVREYYGLAAVEGDYVGYTGCSLTTINDTGGTFDQIADIIENEPYGLLNEHYD